VSARYQVVPTGTFQEDIERLVPFGHGGCVVLFAVRELQVVLLAARDQHEHDYR
jgi:hypothetical protein